MSGEAVGKTAPGALSCRVPVARGHRNKTHNPVTQSIIMWAEL